MPLICVGNNLLFYFRPSPYGKINTNDFGSDDMYGILGRINLTNGNIEDAIKVQNAGSRPAFFKYDNQVYLFTNVYSRSYFQILNVDVNNLQKTVIYSEGYGGYNYPSFFVDGETIYILYTGLNMPVSYYIPKSIGNADIRNILLSLFSV